MNKNCAVLLATYNGEKYVEEQIKSILSQKEVNITIFVSDDSSTDNTLQLIKELNSNNIIILPKINRMGSAAQNFFRLFKDIDLTKYDYISLSDQDDIWFDDKLIRAINKIKNKTLSGYSSNVIAFWEDGRELLIDKSQKETKWDYLFASAGPGCTIVLPINIALLFKELIKSKSELISKINIHHDWLIYAFVRSKNLNWWVDPIPSMMYRQHDNNEVGANRGYKAILYRFKKARNGWYGKEIVRIAKICNQLEALPIKYLLSNSYIDKFRLMINVFSLRRKKNEAIALILMIMIPGFKK